MLIGYKALEDEYDINMIQNVNVGLNIGNY